MKQKHFMDIENLRDTDSELCPRNDTGFALGDLVQISEKIDGANACVAYDIETNALVAFSRNKELSFQNTLSGFWNYVQMLDATAFKAHPDWRVFGEWGVKNKISYDERFKGKWIVYDIYDAKEQRWLPQTLVRDFCQEAGLPYIHVFYEGPFMGWEHVRGFLDSPQYGERQEGVVVKNLDKNLDKNLGKDLDKNLDKLVDEESRVPFYLKIVNEDFKETMARKQRALDPEVEKRKAEVMDLVASIVTRNRVEKELYKLRNEGDLPEKIGPKDMGLVARILPESVYRDCMKEEREVLATCGERFVSACRSLTMRHAREIILG